MMIKSWLFLLPGATVALAQLVEVPSNLEEPIPAEARADGPIPALPQSANPVSREEMARNERDFARFEGDQAKADEAAAQLASHMAESELVAADIKRFSEANNLPALPASSSPPAQPPRIESEPADTVVTCEGRLYVDLKQANRLVYIKDVSVRNPDYELDCDDQLQIYLLEEQPREGESRDKKEAGDQKTPFDDAHLAFDGVKKAVAYGNVFIKSRDKDGKWYEGHASRVTYDGITGEVILSGGYPFLKTGRSIILMKNENGVIRMKDGEILIDGPTVSNVKEEDLPENKRKKKTT